MATTKSYCDNSEDGMVKTKRNEQLKFGMRFDNVLPTEPGFYWCKPVFTHVVHFECDRHFVSGEISIAEVIALPVSVMGSPLWVRFLGYKHMFSITTPVIEGVLWGDRIKCSEK